MGTVSLNHVGLCVRDLERSRRFYEGLLEFRYWWTYSPSDDVLGPGLGLEAPIGLTSLFFFKDGMALELMQFEGAGSAGKARRALNSPGLAYLSLYCEDLQRVMGGVPEHGGQVLHDTYNGQNVLIRDPDGQLLMLCATDWRSALPSLPK
jgi:catechol 2,3-dioxygenase-like lactoylglutathione lyase family enzyme